MIENIKALNIKGGIFDQETDLVLFEKYNSIVPNFSLIYGKNGTGKSTITRGFQKLKSQEDSQIELAVLKDENNEIIEIPEINETIHVFNEKFIEDNIRIKGDGLDTIIVMGTAKNIDDKINELEYSHQEISEEYANKNLQLEKLNDKENYDSKNYVIKRIKNKLRSDNGWAARDKKIKGNITKTPVQDNTYEKFENITSSKSYGELLLEFDKKLQRLIEAKNGNLVIEKEVPDLYEQETNIPNVKELEKLLPLKIEEPKLNDRERVLIQILQEEKGINKLFEIKEYFSGSDEKDCPFCFQKVDIAYSNKLVENIENILSQKAEDHIKKLKKLRLEEWVIDFEPFKQLPHQIVKACKEATDKYNLEILRINSLIEKKISNVYNPVLEKLKLEEYFSMLTSSLLNLKRSRKEFNENANDIESMINELNELNKQLTVIDLEDLLVDLHDAEEKFNSIESECNTLKDKVNNIENELRNLKQQKRNAHIAMEKLNDDLSYIFFSKERLKIEFKDDKYILYSHGKSVFPDNVSIGERNALGLCYFFNNLMNNKEESDIFGQEYLLVIDDPVSSFDMENRIGILSYLKYKLGQYIKGNNKSKFLILTHDLQTFYDLEHLVAEICSSVHRINENATRNKYFKVLELSNKELKEYNLNNKNEYTKLMEIIYDFAKGEELQVSHSIGNIMRKVLEAFGTFVYKKGISQLSTDQSIKSILSNTDGDYFENFMYRLVLNTGSHLAEKVQTSNDLNFFDYISPEEKKRTAKLILVFLYKLNPLHVAAHLKGKTDSEETIKSWSDNLNDIIDEEVDD